MQPDRYALHAYVSRGSVMRMEPFGRVTFAQIYQGRPVGARYAVAGDYNVAVHGDEYHVWDLFSVKGMTMNGVLTGGVQVPDATIVHSDLDAAIMATVLLYDQKGGR